MSVVGKMGLDLQTMNRLRDGLGCAGCTLLNYPALVSLSSQAATVSLVNVS